MPQIAHGDFTRLADSYARHRPGYSPFVLDALVGLCGRPPHEVRAVDVGAGTGIWSRLLAERGFAVTAVEPNDAMRGHGESAAGPAIAWKAGSAEDTRLPDACADLVCMASSFHWPDFGSAVAEFRRILRPGGLFAALWNTRIIKGSRLLEEIEAELYRLAPHIKRVSSGRSEFCAGLSERLRGHAAFEDVLYLEGVHVEQQPPERYLGLWESVNDVRAQAGEGAFGAFLEYVRRTTAKLPFIEAPYLTRMWVARTCKR